MTSRRIPAFVMILVAFATAGCSSGVAVNVGPLGNGEAIGGLCQPTTHGAGITYGLTGFRNSGSSTATITKVDLVDPQGLRMIADSIVSIEGSRPRTYFVGDDAGYPPAAVLLRQPGVGEAWARRQDAVGAKLPPSRKSQPKQRYNLVLGLTVTNWTVGRAKGIDIFYTLGGHPYLLRTGIALSFPVAPRHC
jgi:hypothetical protein